MTTLTEAACEVLTTAKAGEKATLTHRWAESWFSGAVSGIGVCRPPERPARPDRPVLKRPGDMPRRAAGATAGRIALLHALAHIELNAIDLAWDLIARFPQEDWPRPFFDDWVRVADDEARHFVMLSHRLAYYDTEYGDLPAHDGLWQAAADTADDAAARLAIVPMVLEARGLDITPATIAKLQRAGDADSADVLATVYTDEITHVGSGQRWFAWLCLKRGVNQRDHWRALVRQRFRGKLKPPFNDDARAAAGLSPSYYSDLC